MIIKYKYGFELNGVIYGFKDKKLFRLPQMIGLRFYPLKEIPIVEEKRKSGIFKGYRLYGKVRKSLTQVKSMLVFINFEHHEIKDSDIPF